MKCYIVPVPHDLIPVLMTVEVDTDYAPGNVRVEFAIDASATSEVTDFFCATKLYLALYH
jgi:hypothetical protein